MASDIVLDPAQQFSATNNNAAAQNPSDQA